MNRIVLLRHGQSELDGRYVGHTDCGLSLQGQEQIIGLKKTFEQFNFKKVFSSPLGRCQKTVSLLGYNDPLLLENLKEINFGNWEGLNFSEIADSFEVEIRKWVEDPVNFTFPAGENIRQFNQRITVVCKEIIDTVFEGDILIVAHGGTIRFLLCTLLGLPWQQYMAFDPKPGKYAVVTYHEHNGTLQGFNLN